MTLTFSGILPCFLCLEVNAVSFYLFDIDTMTLVRKLDKYRKDACVHSGYGPDTHTRTRLNLLPFLAYGDDKNGQKSESHNRIIRK